MLSGRITGNARDFGGITRETRGLTSVVDDPQTSHLFRGMEIGA